MIEASSFSQKPEVEGVSLEKKERTGYEKKKEGNKNNRPQGKVVEQTEYF